MVKDGGWCGMVNGVYLRFVCKMNLLWFVDFRELNVVGCLVMIRGMMVVVMNKMWMIDKFLIDVGK
jgi:hypothetical protein